MLYTNADFSADGRYRYNLVRMWADVGMVCFIGLNPSTAGQDKDDPTVRRCIGLAKAWGYGGIWMANLFAFISTDPSKLLGAADPVGQDTDKHLNNMIALSKLSIAAWGTWPQQAIRDRASYVMAMHPDLKCLGQTKDGSPRHPLYVPAGTLWYSIGGGTNER